MFLKTGKNENKGLNGFKNQKSYLD